MDGHSVEVQGRTTEEAIGKALDQLGVTRDEVEIEVLTEGRAGVFGVGSHEALVRVTVATDDFDEDEEIDAGDAATDSADAELARETLERMLDLLDFANLVTVRTTQRERGLTTIALDVAGEDMGLLIGRHGETLASLQFLLNTCLSRQLSRSTRILVDIEHYRDRREQSLRGIAVRAAERARRERRPVTLQPMPPSERRVIHLALQSSTWVTTESTGEGSERRVVISPKPTAAPRRANYGYSRGSRG
ncbi:MAG: KH domain-containing protein [Chloroflexi bacterium]|nr:KH domain-containing protein [Chloroflexota bacterium]